MKRNILFPALLIVLLSVVFLSETFAAQEWTSDALTYPSGSWNLTITAVGRVQSAAANPAGTTTGFHLTMRAILIGGAVLFVVLLVIFIFLLIKSKSRGSAKPGYASEGISFSPDETPAAFQRPETQAPDSPEKTQVFMSLGVELTAEKGPETGKQFTLHKQTNMIGRPGARMNDIVLDDETVSKEQASIYYDSTTKKFTITNESKTNPTKVNNKIIMEPLELKDGDMIEMGKSVLRFMKT